MLSKLSIRFFGAAVAGARFFFGFRPRLLGIGKQWVAGTPSAISSHAFGLKALRSGSPELRASIGKKRDANLKSCRGALH